MQMSLAKIQQAELVALNNLHSPQLEGPRTNAKNSMKYLNLRSEVTNTKWHSQLRMPTS